jgi:FKBP-type peptidyl-prolyl cis-trans isomerase
VSSANKQRRIQNREARMVAAEEHLRRSKRQRVLLAGVGLLLAVAVGVVLVARAVGNDDSGKPASSTNTSTSSGTPVGSVAEKPCVAVSDALPPGAPKVPLKIGPPPTKLVKVDLQKGTGAVVKPNAEVTVDYIGVACSTGKIFDSSYQRNESFTTKLGDVVVGWQQGIPGMRVGGQRLLGVPPALGYGSVSPGPGVAPDETLWFVVKVDKTSGPAGATGSSGPSGPTGS